MRKWKQLGALCLVLMLAVSCLTAVPALADGGTTQRIAVYQETFEDGIGDFTTGPEAIVSQRADGTGNHYAMVEVNPAKAEAVATYSRKTDDAGRWGTEFFTWPLQVNPKNFVLQNGKNYQFLFEGSFVKGETFSKPAWGTSVLQVKESTVWDYDSKQGTRVAKHEVFVGGETGDAVAGKDGWFVGRTPESWMKNFGFGEKQEGNQTDGYTYTGDSVLAYFHVRTQLAPALATVMAEKKFYCGKGTGLTNAKGEDKNTLYFGAYYKFTLTRDDFYGDEAIFDGLTGEDEINAKKDEYIYEADGKTLKTYSLGGDCSFLYSKKRIAAFQDYLKNNPVGYAIDNFTLMADVTTYMNNVTVGEHGSVTVVTNPVTGEGQTFSAGASNDISVTDSYGLTGTVLPEAGYQAEKVLYGDQVIAVNPDGTFTVSPDQIQADKTLKITFEQEKESPNALYVAKNGSDTEGDGTAEHPFATIERARDAIRGFKKLPAGGVTVYLREGTYPLSSSVTFTEQDSGTEEAPITYRAYTNETVTFTGSEALDTSAIKKVTEEALLNRLSESYAKDHLYMLDLKAQGVTLPALSATCQTGGERIYMNGAALTNARWPNDDKTGEQYYVRGKTGTLKPEQEGKYNGDRQPVVMEYTDDANRTAKWQVKKDDAFLSGAIAYLWYPQCLRIDQLDAAQKTVVTTDKSNYGQETYTAKTERYLYFENLFEEIDQPGESYLDRETGILYFYPIGSVKDAKMDISRLNQHLITVNGASYLNFEGINFAEGRQDALNIKGSHITVSNATIHGMGGHGVCANGSYITVKSCDIYDYAKHGVDLNGGDRATLTSSENLVTNNRLHGGYGLLSRGVYMEGVGHTVSHNDIFDFTQEAIRYNNLNNAVIEYNDMYEVQLLNADGGAIYAGRNVTDIGNIIRYNYFHNIGGHIGAHGQQSIFTDDGEIGPAIYGNIMYKGGLPNFPLKTNGGQFHQIYQNIIIDNNQGTYMQNWGQGSTGVKDSMIPARWWTYIQDVANLFGNSNSNLFVSNRRKDLVFSDTWKEYYTKTESTGFWAPVYDYLKPELYEQAKALNEKGDKAAYTDWLTKNVPAGHTNFIYDNVWIAVPTIMNKGGWAEVKNNLSLSAAEGKSLFVDYGTDFTLTGEGLATIQKTIPGFKATDFSKIGVQEGEFGSAPAASNAEVLGTAAVGKVLTAEYAYADPDGDPEGSTKIYWYVSDKADGEYTRISDGYGKYYTVKVSDENKYLRYEVIARDTTLAYGEPVVSESVYIDPNATVVDKDALLALISKVTNTLEDAVVGTEAGQYPAEAKAALEAARDEALAVANNKNAYQYQVNSAESKLQEALDLFLGSVNDPTAGLEIERISLGDLIQDEKGWESGQGDELIFKNGALIVGDGAATLAEYTAKNYKNTQFNFTMKPEVIDPSLSNASDAWVGIYLRQESNGWCWRSSKHATMLDLKQHLIQYQQYPVPKGWGAAIKDDMVLNNEKIEMGKTYQVSAGIYDTDVEGQIYLELTLNGKRIYGQTVDGTGMYGLETGHFCISAGENTRLTITPAKADLTELNAQVKAAKSLLETAESGTDYGQYPAAVLEDVQTALTAAEGLTQDSLQYEVDQAALALRKAVSAARNQQIISGPVSKDGQINLIYDSQKAEMNVKSDVTKIDIQVKKGVPMPETIVTGTGVSMTVPAGTAANGNYRLPLVGGNPGGQFKLGDVSKVYGAGASPATVDQPVRIVLQGEAAKTVAYRNEQSSYTQVLKTIEEDTAAAAVAAMAGTRNKAVRINVGNDAVLYSYLITEYVTFTPKAVTPTPTPTPENPGGGTVVNPPSSGGTTGSGNINVTPLNQFRDIAGHWAEKDIQEMAKKGIVSGVTDTTFEPDRSITRAEFATLVVKALNLKSEISAGFTDVAEGAWYVPYVNAAANAGLISGYAGEFRPEDAITREEMAVVIVKTHQFRGGKLESGRISDFADKDQIADWAVNYADQAVSTGFISGITANTFGPKELATRAQVTAVLNRMLNQ